MLRFTSPSESRYRKRTEERILHRKVSKGFSERVLLTALLLSLLLTACSGGGTGTADRNGTVKESAASELQTSSPRQDTPERQDLSERSAAAGEKQQTAAGEEGKIFSAETVLSCEHAYLLPKLSDMQLTAFTELYRAASNFENFCYFSVDVTTEDVKELMTLLHTECPEMFMLDSGGTYHTESIENRVLSVTIPYSRTKTEYDAELLKCRERVKEIAAAAEKEAGDYGKELAAYRAVCGSCTYDQDFESAGDAAGVLVYGRGKCDGISLAFKWVMDELGIPCIVVAGDSPVPGETGHAWNLVKISGTWCAADVTQDCEQEERDGLMYPAFNVTEDRVQQDYVLQNCFEKTGLPECGSMEWNYHVKNGSFVTGTDGKEGYFAAMDRAAAGAGYAPLQFETAEAWENFSKNAESWSNEWMEQAGTYGSSSYVTVDAFRTAEVRLQVNAGSDRMKEINDRLPELEAEIESLKAELEERKAEIEALEERAEAGADAAAVEHINGLIEEYNAGAEEYRGLCDSYNELVNEYNALAGAGA